MFLASVRTVQPRLAMVGLPLFVIGSAVYTSGWGVARRLVFPSCLLLFTVPIPGILQATNELQLIATGGAELIAQIGGVSVNRAGNSLSSAGDAWGFDVAEGCSGIRSLLVLLLAAAIFGHLTQDRFWKKAALFASAVPLAIFANSLRVGSVILLAEYGDVDLAGTVYHDYSTLIFYPIALCLLLVLGSILRGGLHLPAILRRGKGRTRTTIVGGSPVES